MIYNTYEELKQLLEKDGHSASLKIYNTYEELKQDIDIYIENMEQRFIIPMRN
mgnify:CR=1 FL=1